MQKNAIFIFQKINFLNYTFHTRIIRVFPFSILFFCWNEINKKSSIKENCKADNFPEKRFLQKLLELG